MANDSVSVPGSIGRDAEQPPRAWNRWAVRGGQVLFWLWGVAMLVAVSSLMIGHWYTLPRVDSGDPKLRRGLNALRSLDEQDSWLAVHVLYSECRCSQRILGHLFESVRPRDISEKVVLVGEHLEYERRARTAGFSVDVISKSQLRERYGLIAAPLLAVVNPEGSVLYTGGYTDRSQGPDIRDVALIDETRRTGAARELPLFGCAVSKKLQQLLDPLRLKYSRGDAEQRKGQ